MAEPKHMHRIIFLKRICSTEDVFAVILIILIQGETMNLNHIPNS